MDGHLEGHQGAKSGKDAGIPGGRDLKMGG
jgi:hypothetical protein